MKILVDINHPAHVHFFRNFIQEARSKGHEVMITASRKDITFHLLKEYHLDYVNVGSYGKNLFIKLLKIPVLDFSILKIALKFKPDVFMGIASHRAAQISWLLRKKSIIFDDTEHAKYEIFLYKPFASVIATPACFLRNLGKKQLRYEGYHELAYLHPSYFSPDHSILNELDVTENEKYIIMRFISWNASHDEGHKGITLENKRKAVEEFSKFGKVFITSEKILPDDLEKYRLHIPFNRIHHALYYSTLLFGESATMASECAILGTPAIFVDFNGRSYTSEQEKKYSAVFNFNESQKDQLMAIDKGIELLKTPDVKKIWKGKREQILKEKINVTKWMLELIEN